MFLLFKQKFRICREENVLSHSIYCLVNFFLYLQGFLYNAHTQTRASSKTDIPHHGPFWIKKGGWENSFLLYIMLQISVATLEKSANLFSLMHKYMFYNIKKKTHCGFVLGSFALKNDIYAIEISDICVSLVL